MKKSIIALSLILLSGSALADQPVQIACFKFADMQANKKEPDWLVLTFKADDRDYGFIETEIRHGTSGKFEKGLTYFKAESSKDPATPDLVLYTTRQNTADLHKDADFLFFNFKNFNTEKEPLYKAMTYRGHDDKSKNEIYYNCMFMK